ncbi:MAG TPA: hypothetical protein VKV37_19780 [Ktedonobacteraceae bacterium]|jgi:hypothetical protein|nr:hypothetical protein [Ktedonobacteraceae bacterium]
MHKKPPVGKTLAWAYAAVAAFTAISVVVPIIMDRIGRKAK